MNISDRRCRIGVVFDLDDTLFPEMDFVRSAWRELVRNMADRYPGNDPMRMYAIMADAPNAFDALHDHMTALGYSDVPDQIWMRDFYRAHRPADLRLSVEADRLLSALKADSSVRLGLITDGRSLTQRNKIDALELGRFFSPDMILISGETGYGKNDGGEPFRMMSRIIDAPTMVYVGDNPVKDVVWPRRLGWKTVIVKAGPDNVHPQPADPAADYLAESIGAVGEIVDRLRTTG